MSKPDWRDAPNWALWLTGDSIGSYHWWDTEPYPHDDGWWETGLNDGYRCQFAGKFAEPREWYACIEMRPAAPAQPAGGGE